jgi:Molybdopterin-binding domain of aldehyde dehydrogenase
MGLGLALMEETQFDERTGRIANPSLAEYHVPVHMDVPKLTSSGPAFLIPTLQWARAASERSALREPAPRSPMRSTTHAADESVNCLLRSTSYWAEDRTFQANRR